jgi:hypothetical protein
LVTPLPIDDNQIVRAAKEMIAEQGDAAIAQADQQLSVCKCDGFYSVAKTWKLIRDVIRDMQDQSSGIDRRRRQL